MVSLPFPSASLPKILSLRVVAGVAVARIRVQGEGGRGKVTCRKYEQG